MEENMKREKGIALLAVGFSGAGEGNERKVRSIRSREEGKKGTPLP
jgi:hypothetical protein